MISFEDGSSALGGDAVKFWFTNRPTLRGIDSETPITGLADAVPKGKLQIRNSYCCHLG